MLKKLARFIYPSVFKECSNYKNWFERQRDERLKAEDTNRELIKEKTELGRLLTRWKELSGKDYRVLKLVHTKDDLPYILSLREDFSDLKKSIEIIAHDPNKGIHMPFGQLYAEIRKCGDDIFIANLQSEKNENNGIGSAMLTELVSYVDKYNDLYKCMEFGILPKILSVVGNISPEDYDHVEKLKHFYSKHGFVVKTNDIKKEGSIVKEVIMAKPESC